MYVATREKGIVSFSNLEDGFVNVHQIVDNWRRNSGKVIFTNGCFDLLPDRGLHAGHIEVLRSAASFGNVILGLNSDSSVATLKGPTRPLASFVARMKAVLATQLVSAVVEFNEPTPLHLILLVRPDVLVKGGDYREETIVGHRFVASLGGHTHIVPEVPGVHITELLANDPHTDECSARTSQDQEQ